MDPEQRQQFQQTADRATVFCLITLFIGLYIIWANIDQDAPQDALTAFPMMIVTVVHLLGGTIAVYHSVKTGNFMRNIQVYGYFLMFFILAIWVLVSKGSFL